MVDRRNRRESALKLLVAKEIANIGTIPLPATNIFTTTRFEKSFGPFKEPIRKSLGNLDPLYGRRKEIRWK